MSSMDGEPRPASDWENLGRAAEHFARRVARDARTFAARMEEHVGELVRDFRDDESWRRHDRDRRHRHRHWHRDREQPGPEIRRVFEEVRGIVGIVLDEIEELIAVAFPGAAEEPWARVVVNRDTSCGGCGATIATGVEAHVRRTEEGAEFRCVACGVDAAAPPPAA